MRKNIMQVEDRGKLDFYHKKCGGAMITDGTVTYNQPFGFGLRNGKFVFDSIQYKGYSGGCMKCHEEGVWLVGKGKLQTKPFGI